MSLAEAFGRNDIGVDALRHQEGYHRRRAACRQHQIVANTLSLQRGSNGRIVGISVNDDFGVLETPQLRGDIVREFRLASLAELEAAFGELHITRLDEFLL